MVDRETRESVPENHYMYHSVECSMLVADNSNRRLVVRTAVVHCMDEIDGLQNSSNKAYHQQI